MSRRARTSAAVVLPVAAALLASAGGTAYAVAQARATAAQAVGPVSTFGAQVLPRGVTSQAGSFSATLAANSNAEQYAVLRSAGALAVTGQTWTVRAVSAAPTNSVRVDVCQGGTFNGGGQCPNGTLRNLGTVTANGSAATFTTSFALPGTHEVKLTPVVVNAASGTTVTIDIGVSRAQATSASPVSAS